MIFMIFGSSVLFRFLVSPYRNLEILAESGEIQKLEPGGTLKRFDGKTESHYHLRCIRCDRVVDAPVGLDVMIKHDLKSTCDFKIIGHKLEFTGICPDCITSY